MIFFLFLARFEEPAPPSCGFCHIPYDELNMPFPTQLTYCYHCRRQKVAKAKPTSGLSRLSAVFHTILFLFLFFEKNPTKNAFNHFWRYLMFCSPRSTCHLKQLSQGRAASSKPGRTTQGHNDDNNNKKFYLHTASHQINYLKVLYS